MLLQEMLESDGICSILDNFKKKSQVDLLSGPNGILVFWKICGATSKYCTFYSPLFFKIHKWTNEVQWLKVLEKILEIWKNDV